MNTKTKLTVADLDRAARDERWLGFGYLGERARTGSPDVAAADAALIELANARDWDYEKLFDWANSKDGRWFGDTMFGSNGTIAERVAQAVKWGLV